MAKKIKIYVACGSGIATGVVAADAVKAIMQEEGFDAEVNTCRTYDLANHDINDDVDILLSTSNVDQSKYKKPILSIHGLISGVHEDEIRATLVEMCKKAQAKE